MALPSVAPGPQLHGSGRPPIWPAPLTDILAWAAMRGEDAVLKDGALGQAVLVGHLPADAQPTWSFKTRLTLMPNPPGIEKAGLSLDMLCWPLRKRGLSGLLTGALRVGRAPSNEVSLPHIDISKLHARIAFEGSQALLTDAGSANGTTVNGSKLLGTQVAQLRHGDTVGFGPVVLRYLSVAGLMPLLRTQHLTVQPQ